MCVSSEANQSSVIEYLSLNGKSCLGQKKTLTDMLYIYMYAVPLKLFNNYYYLTEVQCTNHKALLQWFVLLSDPKYERKATKYYFHNFIHKRPH